MEVHRLVELDLQTERILILNFLRKRRFIIANYAISAGVIILFNAGTGRQLYIVGQGLTAGIYLIDRIPVRLALFNGRAKRVQDLPLLWITGCLLYTSRCV